MASINSSTNLVWEGEEMSKEERVNIWDLPAPPTVNQELAKAIKRKCVLAGLIPMAQYKLVNGIKPKTRKS